MQISIVILLVTAAACLAGNEPVIDGSTVSVEVTEINAPGTPTTAPPNTPVTSTTNIAPITNATTTKPPTPTTVITSTTVTTPKSTTAASTTPTTSTPTTGSTLKPSSTAAPLISTTPASQHDRKFDGPSFVGGIILALGMVGIGFVAFKFYKARTEMNYHTL